MYLRYYFIIVTRERFK